MNYRRSRRLSMNNYIRSIIIAVQKRGSEAEFIEKVARTLSSFGKLKTDKKLLTV